MSVSPFPDFLLQKTVAEVTRAQSPTGEEVRLTFSDRSQAVIRIDQPVGFPGGVVVIEECPAHPPCRLCGDAMPPGAPLESVECSTCTDRIFSADLFLVVRVYRFRLDLLEASKTYENALLVRDGTPGSMILPVLGDEDYLGVFEWDARQGGS